MNKLILLCFSLCFVYSISCIRFYSSSATLEQNGESYEVSVLVDTSLNKQQINYPFGITELETEDQNTRFQSCEGGECLGIFMSYSIPNYDISSGGSSTTFNGNSARVYQYNDGNVPVTIITSSSGPRVIYQVTQGGDVGRTITFHTFDDNSQENFIPTPDCGNVVCNDAIEIMLVLDSSGSIDEQTEFEDEKQFARDIVGSFSIANDAVRVGIITFATEILVQTPLSGDKDALLADITAITRQGGQTNIGGALDEAHNQLANARPNIPHIIIIVTDGKANRPEPPTNPITYMVEQANEAKADGILIYAIGVGDEVEESDLDLIASGEEYRSHVDNFEDLETTIKSIQGEICTGGSSDGCTSGCGPDEFCGCNLCYCAITQDYCGERGTLDTENCGCGPCNSPYTNVNNDDCSECLEEFDCQNGGTQKSDCSCECPDHTTGDRCETCILNCNGSPEFPNCGGCDCDFPFSGNGCETCSLCGPGATADESCSTCSCNGDFTNPPDCNTCNLDCGNGVEKISSTTYGTCYCDCNNNWEDSEGNCDYCEPCVNGDEIVSCNGCSCYNYWEGDHCEICETTQLSDDCDNHGKVNNDNGECNTCTCTVGDYGGPKCETCPYDCGTGVHNDECTACNCVSPYIDDVNTETPDCSVCDTSADIDYCNNRGSINTSEGNGCDTCSCTPPFTGNKCQTCSFCQNGGTPKDNNACNDCNCPYGWSGNDCSICEPQNNGFCSGKGNITDVNTCNSCTCEEGYSGDTCNSCDYECNGNGEPIFETCDGCDCFNLYDETTDCAECSLDCKNESTENGDCSACNCKEGTGFEGLECDNCPASYFESCQNDATNLNMDTCTCNCSALWSGAVCDECEILDSCGNVTQGAPIHPGISPGHCYCECAEFWEGEHCDRCSLEYGAECPGIAIYTPGDCTCHCPEYYEDIEGCDKCILKEEDCAPNMEPSTTPNTDASVCACQCIGGWTGRDCQDCPVTCDEKLGLYFNEVTCTCDPICGDGIVADEYEECEPPNRPCCDAECYLIEGPCDNGNKCTKNDVCKDDECVAGDDVDCDDNDACTLNDCDPDMGCILTHVNCNDNDDCTEEYCDPGFGCRYSGVECDDGNVCTRDYCLRNGGCQYEDLSDQCNDFDVCTTDSCDPVNGCSNEVTTTCEPRNACETAECDPIRGCVYFPIECPESSDLCKVGFCDENVGCTFEDLTCSDDGDLCTTETCDSETGLCSSTEIECFDENVDDCILAYCDNGVCVSGTEPDCNDNDPCTVDTCVSFTCVHTPVECATTDLCFPEVCVAGQCVSTPVECPNSDADCEGTICENGACVPKAGATCDDFNSCTTDVCDNGVCKFFENTCNDFNGCTDDSCDPETGECINTPIDISCESDLCVERECDPETGTCVVVSSVNCDSNHACATGECNPETGLCEVTEFNCDDGSFCTIDICEEGENGEAVCRYEQRICPQSTDLCVANFCSEDSDSCETIDFLCASDIECIEGTCIDGNCVFTRIFGCGISAVPDPSDPIIIEEPSTSSSSSSIGAAGVGLVNEGGGDSGASAVANEASVVLANNYSTTVVAVGGVGLVITFAFFAAVLGFNNSKQQPEVPLDALLEQTEADMIAYDNPLGTSAPDAILNIAST